MCKTNPLIKQRPKLQVSAAFGSGSIEIGAEGVDPAVGNLGVLFQFD
jgi:hypothetical protein